MKLERKRQLTGNTGKTRPLTDRQLKDAAEKANEQCLEYDREYKVYGSEGRKYFGGWTPPDGNR